ncbi:hypothetical protein [Streptomyces sp. NPDC026673]|uniref:hypothetical protein n=1 Tax=Streptomyces sp. NPDC026673 TaxID=3155724 RepID=UPI0033EB6AEA
MALSLAGVGWRLRRYPGGWSFAFSDRHHEDREALDRARRAVRHLRGQARRELATARRHVARADRSHRRRVDNAARRIARLRQPGNGRFISLLGKVSLYEHAIVISGPKPKALPLDGMQVRFEHSPVGHHIYLRRPDGVHLESYATARHTEESVRGFSVRIENQVAKEDGFRTELTASVKKAEDELTSVQADTRSTEQARRRLNTVTARQSRDTVLAAALARLDAARDQWQCLTGRRPPC